jgi:hypothetical protein
VYSLQCCVGCFRSTGSFVINNVWANTEEFTSID